LQKRLFYLAKQALLLHKTGTIATQKHIHSFCVVFFFTN